MTDTIYVRELDPSHPSLNQIHPQPVQTKCCPNVNSRTPDAPRKGVKLHQHEVSNSSSGYPPTKTEDIADASRPSDTQSEIDHDRPRTPSQGVAKRPERCRPVPCVSRLPSHRPWYHRSVPSVQFQSDPTDGIRNVPTVGNPTLHGTTVHTPTAWCHMASRAVPTCTHVENVAFSQIMVSPERPICVATTPYRNLPTL